MQTIATLAILFTGYSLFCALALGLGHFRRYSTPLAGLAGQILLLALAALQLCHFAWLYLDLPWVLQRPYFVTLYLVAPAFYLFSRPLLQPEANNAHPALLLHGLPVLLSVWVPPGFALPLAFSIGAGYLLWLLRVLYPLRQERENFHREMLLLGAVFAIASGVSLLGLLQTTLPGKLFYSLYAIAIGLAFLLVQLTLAMRPQLEEEVNATVHTAYSNTTLGNVDCDAALARLAALMQTQQLYLDAELSLAGLAEAMSLSSHQLSELLNSCLGKGFARYLREQRVAAAQRMLCEEPGASVLSVGLSVGFTSQSNFYEAFREIAGTTPGQYRKLHQGQPAAPAN
ncbi:helix-turn-helix domain-containing protein [Vogesella sp. LIG4]|uniref:AraC family transcriptional regulator n=1 Tax=Vogesella sp. LIG4 TaxID=1192162 RepID=UPI00081FC1A2|nr:helix-turn-helix domain-containing protein [Vogesella sp. LIG4]SCK13809.1 Transcriptional regulator containing an amidase domain and an AraC-type DNA-binding HTH domain [Vogesella sp. LIG4]